MASTEPTGPPGLPAEPPDGTWLHLPDLHGSGYTDVICRDDAEGHADRRRAHDRHWWSFGRREWIDWPDAVRHGAAHKGVQVLDEFGRHSELLIQARRQRDELGQALMTVLYDLHPAYPNTSRRGRGVGASVISVQCNVVDPEGDEEQAIEAASEALRSWCWAREEEGQ